MAVGDRITFPRHERKDSVTGRRWTQITSGPGYTYPLYYFGPTLSRDGKSLVFNRYQDNEVQNWKLDIATGDAVQLTNASTPNCLWRPWDEPVPACGVRELMSALSPARDELLYFDSNLLRAVHIHTLADRTAYEMPKDRVPCGLPGASPDGRWLALVHCDRSWWEQSIRKGAPVRHEAQGVRLDVVDLDTGSSRTLVVLNCWLTHANFYDNERVLFSNAPTECAVMMTDLRGGWYAHLRTQTTGGWVVNHYLPTQRGIMYETVSQGEVGMIGICDPDTYACRDFRTDHPISHCAHDPEGRFWFGHVYRMSPRVESFLAYLPSLKYNALNAFVPLTEGMNPFGRNQRSHLHPLLMPDRKSILFTGPDAENKTNHIFLLDVADLADTETKVAPA